jgi:predicted phage tail protein
MLTVIFYGELRQRFARRFVLDVHSPREALHALMVQLPGLRAFFGERATHAFLVRGPYQDYDETDLHYPQRDGILKVVPLVSGSGSWGKILGGAALAAVGVIASPFTGGASMMLVKLGIAVALAGVAQLLAPRQGGAATPEKADNQPSLAFDGAVNTTGQGGPVPLGYGRVLIGSQVISVGFSTNNEISVN